MTDPNSASARVLELADEFLERYRQGQRPALGEYTARYPELAAEIREVFPAMAMMERIALADVSIEGHRVPATPTPLPRHRQLGDYRILRELGRGGMGLVYEAEQLSLGRHVALKVLPQGLIRDPKQQRRFEREAKAAARLHHTNIVPVFGVGEDDGTPFYAMQFIPGLGLDQVLEELKRQRKRAGAGAIPREAAPADAEVTASDVARSLLESRLGPDDPDRIVARPDRGGGTVARGDALTADGLSDGPGEPVPAEAASLSSSSAMLLGLGSSGDPRSPGSPRPTYWRGIARIGSQVADALAYAHSQGVLHRDIKPSNLLLDARGTVWVTDFGLAKVDDQQGLTHTGDILGTLRYMPPEAFEGRHDARGDIYSLGLSLYEMLGFRPAFDESERGRLVRQVTSGEPPRLRSVNPEVPRDLETIVHKAIDREPGHRYATAAALAEDLRRFLDGNSILARRSSSWERAAKWARRRPALAAMITAVQILLVAMLGTVAWSYSNVRKALIVAEDRRVAAEHSRAKEADARREAEAARNAALTETARALLSETRVLRLSHEAGWRDEAMRNLGRLATMDTASSGLFRLRTEAVACLSEPDARPLAEIGAGDLGAWEVKFHPDGRSLAVNDQFHAMIRLREVEGGRPIRDIPKASGRAPFAFRPDGSCLAFGAPANRVVYEPMAEGAEVPAPLDGPGAAIGLAFDRQGARIAVAWGHTAAESQHAPVAIERVVVYDVASGRDLRTIRGPFDDVNFKVPLAINPDGSAVATMGPDHRVQVWKVAGDEPPATLGRHLAQVVSMAFAPDGASLATGRRAPDSVVKLWDVAAARERLALHGHSATVWAVSFSPDGGTLASAGNDLTIRFWDARDGRQRLIAGAGTGGICLSLAFAPDGRKVAVGGNTARVVGVEGFDARKTLAGHDNVAFDLAFRPGHSTIASASLDHHVITWDTRRGSRRVINLPGTSHPLRLAYTPDGSFLLVGPASADPSADPEESQFIIRMNPAAAGGPRFRLMGARSDTTALVVDPSGRWIASGHQDGMVIAWDAAKHSVHGRFVIGAPIRFVVFLPALDGAHSTVLAATSGGRAALLDLAGGLNRVATIPGDPQVFAVSPKGDRLAVGSNDGSIGLFGLPDLAPLARFEGDRGSVGRLAYHPNGRLLASASSDRRVVIRDAGTLQPLLEIDAPMAQVNALVFSPDGTSLAFTGSSEDITLWDFGRIGSQLDLLGLGVDATGSSGMPAPSPAVRANGPAWVGASGLAIPLSGLDILDAEAGPGLPSTVYRQALDELLRVAESLPGVGELKPDEATLRRDIACLHLLLGDRPAFDRLRETLLARMASGGPAASAGEVGWTCSLTPGVDDPDRAVDLAERAIRDDSPGDCWWRVTLACALLRAEQYQEALDSLDVADRLGPMWPGLALDDLVRSIIRARQGRVAEARSLLDSALARAGRPRGGRPAPGRILHRAAIQDMLTFEVLRREAEQLLLGADGLPADPFARQGSPTENRVP